MDQFPKWKYADDGRTLIVDDADAEEALGDGWYDSPAEIPDPNEAHEGDGIEALRAEATALGIEVDKRWKEKRLQEEIVKAKGA